MRTSRGSSDGSFDVLHWHLIIWGAFFYVVILHRHRAAASQVATGAVTSAAQRTAKKPTPAII